MKKIIYLFIFCLLMFPLNINAELIDNGDGTITQIRIDGSKLMWLKDANHVLTSGWCGINDCAYVYTDDYNYGYDYGYGRRLYYYEVSAFINYLNENNYLGYNDWRLPKHDPINGEEYNLDLSHDGSTDRGHNATAVGSLYEGNVSNEFAYLFYYELGNLGQYDLNGYIRPNDDWFTNSGPFNNIMFDSSYITSSWCYSTNDEKCIFSFYTGSDGYIDIDTQNFTVWPVRDNNVELSCFDGIDNDNDNLIDCTDSDCDQISNNSCNTGLIGNCSIGVSICSANIEECIQSYQPQNEICNDNIDNDCDGYTDMDDSDCVIPDPSENIQQYIHIYGDCKVYSKSEDFASRLATYKVVGDCKIKVIK